MSQNFFIVKDDFEYAGDHLIIDIFNGKNLDNEIHVHSTLLQCVEAAGATLLHIDTHQFELNGGISGVAVLAESHISIHTWPEKNYAAMDIFMCGNSKPQLAIPVIKASFKTWNVEVTQLCRGKIMIDS